MRVTNFSQSLEVNPLNEIIIFNVQSGNYSDVSHDLISLLLGDVAPTFHYHISTDAAIDGARKD